MHSFCFVLTKLPVYISLALNYFQNKIPFSEKLKEGGDFQAKCLQGGDFTKKVEDHRYIQYMWIQWNPAFSKVMRVMATTQQSVLG